MKGKNILITVALVLGFGGLVATNVVGIQNNNKLANDLSNLRSDMEAADASIKAEEEANIAAAKAEAVALITTTRDNLMAAYQAGMNTVTQGLLSAKTEIETAIAELAGQMEAGEAALAGQLQSGMAQLVELISEVSDDLDAGLITVEEALEEIGGAMAELQAQVDDNEEELYALEEFVLQQFLPAYNNLAQLVSGLNTTVGQLSTAVASLQTAIANDYYTKAQMNGKLEELSNAIATLTNLFKDSEGNIVQMKAVLAQLKDIEDDITEINSKLTTINGQISTLQGQMSSAQSDIAAANSSMNAELSSINAELDNIVNTMLDGVGDKIDEINEKLDKFYGAEAQKAKGGQVQKLSQYFIDFKASVIDKKEKEIKDANEGVVPEAFQPLFVKVNELYNTKIRAILDEGIARIILAKDVTEAEAMEKEYETKMSSYMYTIDVLAAKETAKVAIEKHVTDTAAYDVKFLAADVTRYETLVAAVAFDEALITNPDKTAADVKAAYEEAIAKIDQIVAKAAGYKDLLGLLDTATDSIKDLDTTDATPGHLTTEQVTYFVGLNNTKAAFADFDTAFDALGEDGDADELLDKYEEYFGVVVDGAESYDEIVLACTNAISAIEADTNVLPADITTLKGKVTPLSSFDTFKALLEDVLDDSAETTIEENEADVKAEASYYTKVAALLDEVTTYADGKKAEIDGLSYLTGKSYNGIFKAAASAEYTLTKVLALTEGLATDNEFNGVKEDIEEALDNIVDCAAEENKMISYLEQATTFIAGLDIPAIITDGETYFASVISAGYAHYSMVASGALKEGVDLVSETGVAEAKAAFDSYSDDLAELQASVGNLIAVVNAGNALKVNMDKFFTDFKTSFTTNYHNTNGDETTALTSFAGDFTAIYEDRSYVYGVSYDALPDRAGKTYEEMRDNFNNYVASLDNPTTDMSDRLQGYKDDMNEQADYLIAEYLELDALYTDTLVKAAIGYDKDGNSGTLFNEYTRIKALLEYVAVESAVLEQYEGDFRMAVSFIKNAQTSAIAEAQIAAAMAKLKEYETANETLEAVIALAIGKDKDGASGSVTDYYVEIMLEFQTMAVSQEGKDELTGVFEDAVADIKTAATLETAKAAIADAMSALKEVKVKYRGA